MPITVRSRGGRLVAAGVLVLLTQAAGGPARAAEPALPPVTISEELVGAAQARVQAVSAEVSRVAVELTAGTEQWKAGKVQLERAQLAAAQAQARAEDAARIARDRHQSLLAVVAAGYRSPVTAPLLLRSGGGGAALTDALRTEADLRRIRGNQQDALARADQAGEIASQTEQDARSLQAAAADQERALAADLAGLVALADRTNDQLQQATAEADRLEGQRAAELVRREAARIAAEQAARIAAEQAAQAAQAAEAAAAAKAATSAQAQAARQRAAEAAARAGRPPAPAQPAPPTSGGSCAGRPVGGYANGAIPASALCPLRYASGHLLRADAAAAFNRLTEAAAAARGAPLCVTDSYRSYAGQVRLYREKPDLAAIPGTSNHGWGVAVDLCGGVQDYATSAYAWMKANAGRYGWIHPAWAEPGGSRQEPWHWEYTG